MKSIYLAGHINPNIPETLRWREEAHELLRGDFLIISPLDAGEDLTKDKFACAHDGVESSRHGGKAIVTSCFRAVTMEADIVLVMLDTFGSPRPMCGTFFELAWAWNLGIPVIGIYPDLPHRDPFLLEAVTEWRFDVRGAAKYLVESWA